MLYDNIIDNKYNLRNKQIQIKLCYLQNKNIINEKFNLSCNNINNNKKRKYINIIIKEYINRKSNLYLILKGVYKMIFYFKECY